MPFYIPLLPILVSDYIIPSVAAVTSFLELVDGFKTLKSLKHGFLFVHHMVGRRILQSETTVSF